MITREAVFNQIQYRYPEMFDVAKIDKDDTLEGIKLPIDDAFTRLTGGYSGDLSSATTNNTDIFILAEYYFLKFLLSRLSSRTDQESEVIAGPRSQIFEQIRILIDGLEKQLVGAGYIELGDVEIATLGTFTLDYMEPSDELLV